jgi:hypothetical protein
VVVRLGHVVGMTERDETRDELIACRELMLSAGWSLAQVIAAYPLPPTEAKLEDRFAKAW